MNTSARAERGVEVIREAEAALQQLMAEASAAGDYEAVVQLASMAKGLARLINESATAPSPPPAESPAPSPRTGATRGKRKRRGQTKRKSEYPKFVRQGDELVKLGWSKRQKKEYRHRAPKRLVELLAQRLAEVGKEGKLLTTDDLLPLHDPDDGSEFPTYQGYIGLAWFVTAGLIERHGRQGYTVCDPDAMKARIEALWRALQTA